MAANIFTFGISKDGQEVKRIVLENKNGMRAEILTFGATVIRLFVPDKDGHLADVVLGYDTIEEYEAGTSYFGCIAGRVCNRIANGEYERNGVVYSLTKNEKQGRQTLHGGGYFHHKVWKIESLDDGDEPSVLLSVQSPDTEEGFPGNLDVQLRYTVTAAQELVLSYKAKSDKETPINLTNHSYFNLSGFDGPNVLENQLTLYADATTEIDENLIPTGRLLPVAGTPFDFTKPKRIGKDINADDEQMRLGGGYDHNFMLGKRGVMRHAATLLEEQSGRVMEVFTDRPGIQFYTNNISEETDKGKNGVPVRRYGACCLETQDIPDAVHHDNFPSVFYRPGEEYTAKTIYQFSVVKK